MIISGAIGEKDKEYSKLFRDSSFVLETLPRSQSKADCRMYQGDSELGKLMHDFNCTRADDMNYELIAERTRYLKEDPEGVNEMCQIMEEMRTESLKKGIKQGAVNSAKRMIEAGKYALEEIVNISGLSLEEVEKLKMHLNV